jgi:hypothetical protein
MWEDAGPRDHYIFWCRLNACLAPAGAIPRVETAHGRLCLRDSYGFKNLYFVDEGTGKRPIQDRMVRLGRMGLACELSGLACGYEQRITSEDMPETYEAYLAALGMKDAESDRFMVVVTVSLARVYYHHPYCQAYGVKQMKDDVKAIKAAMKQRVRPTTA